MTSSDADWSRRSFLSRGALLSAGLATLPAAGLLAACGSSATKSISSGSKSSAGAAAAKVSFQLSYLPSVEYAGYYVASKKGYYQASKIDETNIDGGPSVAIEATVAAGKALVGIDSADVVMQARQKGAPLVMFAAQFQKNPLGIVSLSDKPLSTPQSLVGKKIGVPTSLETTMKQFLTSNGIKPSSITFVPYQGDAGPLINKTIDAGMTFVTSTVPLLDAKNVATTSFLFADFGYAVYNDCCFTTETVLKERPEDLARWLRATIRGWQDNNADPSYGVDLVVNEFGKSQGLTKAGQTSQAKSQLPLISTATTKAHGLFWMDDADITANLKTIKSLGIKADAKGFDTSILTTAYAGKSTIDGP